MTKLLEEAIEAARRLPPPEQDEIARAVLRLAGADQVAPVPLTLGEREAIARCKAAAARRFRFRGRGTRRLGDACR